MTYWSLSHLGPSLLCVCVSRLMLRWVDLSPLQFSMCVGVCMQFSMSSTLTFITLRFPFLTSKRNPKMEWAMRPDTLTSSLLLWVPASPKEPKWCNHKMRVWATQRYIMLLDPSFLLVSLLLSSLCVAPAQGGVAYCWGDSKQFVPVISFVFVFAANHSLLRWEIEMHMGRRGWERTHRRPSYWLPQKVPTICFPPLQMEDPTPVPSLLVRIRNLSYDHQLPLLKLSKQRCVDHLYLHFPILPTVTGQVLCWGASKQLFVNLNYNKQGTTS